MSFPGAPGRPPADHLATPAGVSPAGRVGTVVLAPVLAFVLYVEIAAAISDSIHVIDATHHHLTAPLWLGIFAVLAIGGPITGFIAFRQMRRLTGDGWQALLRAETVFALVGLPAALMLLVM